MDGDLILRWFILWRTEIKISRVLSLNVSVCSWTLIMHEVIHNLGLLGACSRGRSHPLTSRRGFFLFQRSKSTNVRMRSTVVRRKDLWTCFTRSGNERTQILVRVTVSPCKCGRFLLCFERGYSYIIQPSPLTGSQLCPCQYSVRTAVPFNQSSDYPFQHFKDENDAVN